MRKERRKRGREDGRRDKEVVVVSVRTRLIETARGVKREKREVK